MPHAPVDTSEVHIPTGDAGRITGDLTLPPAPRGLVLFAHGSGSSRHSVRNRMVARSLNTRGLATLLVDLLTPDEERVDAVTRHLRFDIPLLARRLSHAIEWLAHDPGTRRLPVCLFGASTGAAAALIAAADRPDRVAAVVSRGGRPDLAGDALPRVVCPVLLIVGERDNPVLELNREAAARMSQAPATAVIPNATHLFEEPGALERVSRTAADWLLASLKPPPAPPAVGNS